MIQKAFFAGLVFALASSLGLNTGPAGRKAAEAAIQFDVAAAPFFFAEGGVAKQVLRITIDNPGSRSRDASG